jgi:5-methyltetrahydropteroyltriglutamate--homocysteine methyltransferase
LSASPHPGGRSAAAIGVPIFRAEVVGSLLRPPALQRAVAEREAGRLTEAELAQAQAQAIREALAIQAACGLQVCTDGEIRRRHFADPLLAGLRCFGSAPGHQEPWRDAAGLAHGNADPRAVTARLDFSGSDAIDAFRFAAGETALPVKVTVPSPTYLLSRWVPGISSRAYPDPFDLFLDTAEILAGLVSELADAGCRYIQFDAPELTAVVDPEARARLEGQRIAPERLIDGACELIDGIVARVSAPRVKFAVHLCRGNLRGLWRKRGGYERLAETFFTQLAGVDTFMLEFDDERSGTFECLSRLPADKVAVLGLITTKRGELEPADELATRVMMAASYVPLERLAVSTQCGFASTAEGNPLTPEQQRQKLELVAELARSLWPGGPAPA